MCPPLRLLYYRLTIETSSLLKWLNNFSFHLKQENRQNSSTDPENQTRCENLEVMQTLSKRFFLPFGAKLFFGF